MDETTYRYRRGYWLRVVRRRRRMDLASVAKAMGYSAGSASTFSLWEDGKRDPSDVQLRKLSDVYGVPVEVFTDPDETDEERLDRRIAVLEAERKRRDLQVS
jgi:transcriptional regulator with XRE-family HTH domain